MGPEVWIARIGVVPYDAARELQKRLEAARQADSIPDVLLLLEHSPVYTKGRRSTSDELPMGEDWYRMQGIEVTDTDRGGRVTYHGPGQLVGYPIVDLRALGNRATLTRGPAARVTARPSGALGEDVARIDVVEYIRRMERVMIASLGEWDVDAGLVDGQTGVWVPVRRRAAAPRGTVPPSPRPSRGSPRKIGSIGVHVNRGVTTHGFAINVNNDLQPFEWIVPCGIEACQVTSLCRELGAEQDMARFTDTVARRFGEVYGRRPVEVPPSELDARAGTTEPEAQEAALS